jgi:hypothetical protein
MCIRVHMAMFCHIVQQKTLKRLTLNAFSRHYIEAVMIPLHSNVGMRPDKQMYMSFFAHAPTKKDALKDCDCP